MASDLKSKIGGGIFWGSLLALIMVTLPKEEKIYNQIKNMEEVRPHTPYVAKTISHQDFNSFRAMANLDYNIERKKILEESRILKYLVD